MALPLNYNGKSGNWHLLLSHCRYLTTVLQKYSMSIPLPTIWILSKPLNLIGCHGNRKAKFAKTYSNIISSEAIRGMKLKLCRNVHNISLYKNCIFIAIVHVLSLLWQLKSFHWLTMGKVKVGLYCYFIVDILTKVLQRCSLSSPLPNIWILSKPLNLLGYHANRKDKCAKKYLKNHLLRSHKGD